MSSSTKIHQQRLITKKYILILEIGPTQGLEHTLNAEKMHSINFTEKKFFFFGWAYTIIEKIVTYF